MTSKIFCFLVLFCSPLFIAAQYKVIVKEEDSKTMRGTIGGEPITLHVQNKEIIDCDYYDTYVEGWILFEKNNIKVPLTGFASGCNLKLFHYGNEHAVKSKQIAAITDPENLEQRYKDAGYEALLSIDRCSPSEKKNTEWNGEYQSGSSRSVATITADQLIFGFKYEYFVLPNKQTIDLRAEFEGYGGNEFYSLKEDVNENRVIFYFESESNHNACGRCGASEGEKGYRLIRFDKNWNLIKKEEFLIESCLETIPESDVVSKTTIDIKYKVQPDGPDEATSTYYLVVNKTNATIKKENPPPVKRTRH